MSLYHSDRASHRHPSIPSFRTSRVRSREAMCPGHRCIQGRSHDHHRSLGRGDRDRRPRASDAPCVAGAILLALAMAGARRRQLAVMTAGNMVWPPSAALRAVPHPGIAIEFPSKVAHGKGTPIRPPPSASSWLAKHARTMKAHAPFFPEAAFEVATGILGEAVGAKVAWRARRRRDPRHLDSKRGSGSRSDMEVRVGSKRRDHADDGRALRHHPAPITGNSSSRVV